MVGGGWRRVVTCAAAAAGAFLVAVLLPIVVARGEGAVAVPISVPMLLRLVQRPLTPPPFSGPIPPPFGHPGIRLVPGDAAFRIASRAYQTELRRRAQLVSGLAATGDPLVATELGRILVAARSPDGLGFADWNSWGTNDERGYGRSASDERTRRDHWLFDSIVSEGRSPCLRKSATPAGYYPI